jgi:hypothetical protein
MLHAVRDEPRRAREPRNGEAHAAFDVAAAVQAHPLIALGIALGAGALYALAHRAGRMRSSDMLGGIAVAALAGATARMVRTYALRMAIALWRAPAAPPDAA